MSDHAAQSYNDGNGSVRQSCQPAQMAEWASLSHEFKQDGHATKHRSLLSGSESEANVSVFAKESREVMDERPVTSLRKERYDCKPYIHGKEVLALQIDPNSGYEYPSTGKFTKPYLSKLEWVSPKAETPENNYNFQHLGKPVKFHNFFEKKRLPASRSSKDDFMGSTSKTLPYGVSNSAPILSMCIGEEVNPSNSGLASKEHMANSQHHMAKFKGKMLSELPSLSPVSGFYGRKGVKLQLLGSSTDSDEKESSEHVNVKTSLLPLKNESSNDTDTLEMNASHLNHLSGTTSSPSNKDVDGGQVLASSQVAVASAREILLDINQRLPEFPAVASSADDRDTSSSRTQSLDLERFFSNAEEAADSKSNAEGPDPSSRWIKRLKLSSSNSLAHGTKRSKLPEASSREKADKLFSKRKTDRTSSSESLNKPVGHSWIRRWCHNQGKTTQKSSEAVVICEPETFKETSEKFQKKHFPSIAAMALMGKAMKHFDPCEFQNLGTSVVWNTKRF